MSSSSAKVKTYKGEAIGFGVTAAVLLVAVIVIIALWQASGAISVFGGGCDPSAATLSPISASIKISDEATITSNLPGDWSVTPANVAAIQSVPTNSTFALVKGLAPGTATVTFKIPNKKDTLTSKVVVS